MADNPTQGVRPASIQHVQVSRAAPFLVGDTPMVGIKYRGRILEVHEPSAKDLRDDGSTMLFLDLEKAETLLAELQDAVEKVRSGELVVDPLEATH
ncbi:MAG: hypothetical protein OXQ29_27640 [Rhodospirillaceae bacterium]|nr:hypothetical protein [Rhodospirillaceae bacterium]